MAAVIVVLSSLAAVMYVWRIVEQAYFGEPSAEGVTTGEAPWPLLAGVWMVALANVYFGVLPELPVALAESAATELLRHLP